MRVPMLDLTRIEVDVQAEIEKRVTRVLRSGRFILGPEVEEFEHKIAEYLGVRYAIGVSSGTDALIVSLMALGIDEDSEVVVPAYTFCATAEAVVRVGARPVFADCAPGSFLMDASVIKPRQPTIPVHVFGEPFKLPFDNDLYSDAPRIAPTAHEPLIIEDAAQAIGAHEAGGMGLLGCFSFFPSKNLGAMGDGGLVTTNSEALAMEIRSLRSHGRDIQDKYLHYDIGGNFRLDEIQAAVLNAKLPMLDTWTARRSLHAWRYHMSLADCPGVTCPRRAFGHVWNQYVIRVPAEWRDRVRDYLLENGVETAIYWPTPLHRQPAFTQYYRGPLPHAELASQEAIALPISPWHTREEIEYVAEMVRESVAL